MKITSYLVFNGNAEEAANFYANRLGEQSKTCIVMKPCLPGRGCRRFRRSTKKKSCIAVLFFPVVR